MRNDFICISRTAAAACCCCCARIYLIYLTWRGREPRFQIPGQHFVKKKRFLWRADSIQLQRKPFTCNSSGASWRTILPLKQVFLFCWWLNPHAVRVLKKKERTCCVTYTTENVCSSLVTILRFAQLHPVFHFPPTNKERGLLPSLFTFIFSSWINSIWFFD